MKRPKISDKTTSLYVDYLEQKLSVFESSPYVKTYITIYNQIDSFNEQLTLKDEREVQTESGPIRFKQGFVDLFADKDSKEFDRTKWFFENILSLNKNLDELRRLMNPAQEKELSKILEKKSLNIAEKIALENRKLA